MQELRQHAHRPGEQHLRPYAQRLCCFGLLNRLTATLLVTELCWHNEDLIEYLISQARKMLTAVKDQPGPPVRFFSVTQNDNGLMCQDKEELAIVAENGGAVIAPMLRATNRIARALADEFPDVLFDTFACTRGPAPSLQARGV